jgi:hypothetical protein
VTNLLDAGPGSLRQAILDTPEGGTVDLQPGLTGTIALTTGELAITKDLTIAGPGATVITVSGNQASRVLNIAATHIVTISGLTIADGSALGTIGGGILNAGTLIVTASTLSGNSAALGGGIFNNGTLIATACTLSGNSAGYGGGINNQGTLTVSNSTLSGNSASIYGSGGGIYNQASLTVTSSTLSGNSAGISGGGINNQDTLAISNSTLSGNTALAGGGIYNQGTLTVSNSAVSGNNSAGEGGGIDNYGTLTVTGSTLSGNSAGEGGGIFNWRTLTVSNSTLSGNSANSVSTGGGGIDNFQGTLTVINSTLTANQANGHGGGLYVGSGSPVLHNTLIAGNFRGATGTNRDDVAGALHPGGAYNLIGDATGMTGLSDGVNGNLVGSVAAPIDPLLGPLQDHGGPTLTHALLAGSPALNAGDPNQLGAADQRGVIRAGGVNIGAYQASAASLTFTTPDMVTAGEAFKLTVKAVDPFEQTAVGYSGMVYFAVSNEVTAEHTFTVADGGQHTFSKLVLTQAGTYTVAGTDTANPLITGSTTFTITPGAADHIAFSVPDTITAGMPFAITVTVQDAYGNTVTDYVGTVHFTLTGQATAQADYTFTASDMGSHTFSNLVLSQAGDYTLTATDEADPTISGSSFFTVLG